MDHIRKYKDFLECNSLLLNKATLKVIKNPYKKDFIFDVIFSEVSLQKTNTCLDLALV